MLSVIPSCFTPGFCWTWFSALPEEYYMCSEITESTEAWITNLMVKQLDWSLNTFHAPTYNHPIPTYFRGNNYYFLLVGDTWRERKQSQDKPPIDFLWLHIKIVGTASITGIVTVLGYGVATGTKFNPNILFCWLMVWEIALQCESGDLWKPII